MSNVFEFKHFSVHQEHAAMKVGTDSDLLGVLAAGGKRILDIGTGTGILSLMLAQRFPSAKITAIDIDDDAVKDAKRNFEESPFSDRIELIHVSFQDYLKEVESSSDKSPFDCIICNPPYFDKSLESPDKGRSRARHTSSLPFNTLIEGAFSLLSENGVFSVCIPPEVLSAFSSECIIEGFWPKDTYYIKSVPEKPVKRIILIYQKGRVLDPGKHTFCMRNSDHSLSDWYKELMHEFHL